MAGVITHLVIGNEILKLLPENTIRDQGLFYLGTVAPDAVHSREDYVRAHKKHSHFRDDIPDRDFEVPDNYALYRKRLVSFIQEHNNQSDPLYDYFLGYVVHILSDELFVLSIRKEFCDTMELLGIDQSDRPFFDYIVTDMNRSDMLMVNQYDDMEKIRRFVEETPEQSVEGYISSREMNACRDWLIHQHFIMQHELLPPVYITYARMMEFVQNAAFQIVQLLSEDKVLPRML